MPAFKTGQQVGATGVGMVGHLTQDAVTGTGPFSPDFMENLLGRRSGGVNKQAQYAQPATSPILQNLNDVQRAKTGDPDNY